MAPKNKRGKGKAIKIEDFIEEFQTADVYDDVDDSWLTDAEILKNKVKEKIMRTYSRTENNAILEGKGFRETSDELEAYEELKPPFVAHVANLRNGITDESFLSIFNENEVKSHHLINRDGKTYAFVEFTIADALEVALAMDKTRQQGRLMHVNLANQKQIERYFTNDSGKNISSPTERSFANLSRDVFGATSNGMEEELTSPLSRDMFGANSSQTANLEITRDIIGSAIDTESPDSPVSPLTFDNWRSGIALAEHKNSDDKNGNENDMKSPPGNGEKMNFRRSAGDSKRDEISSPLTMENWRSDRDTHSKFDTSGKVDSAASKSFNADGGNWRKESSPSRFRISAKKIDGCNSSFGAENPRADTKGRNSSPTDDRWSSLRK